MEKFIVTADWHIRDNHNLKKTLDAILRVIDIAKDNDVHDVFVAGDIFDTSRPTNTEHNVFAYILGKCYDSGIHFYFMPGNHDISGDGTFSFQYANILPTMSEYIHVINEPAVFSYEKYNLVLIPPVYTGINKSTRQILNERGEIRHLTGDKNNIIISHFPLTNVVVGGVKLCGEMMMSLDDLHEFIPNSTWLLGDIHESQTLRSKDYSTTATYCGSVERITFTDAPDDKGVLLYDGDIKFISLNPIPMFDITIDNPINESFLEDRLGLPFFLDKYRDKILKLHISIYQSNIGSWINVLKNKLVVDCYYSKVDVTIVPDKDVDIQEMVNFDDDLITVREYVNSRYSLPSSDLDLLMATAKDIIEND